MAEEFEFLQGKPRPEWFACADPSGQPLGSGGGTSHLLASAWKATAPDRSFADWLRGSRKLVLHSGGQSRRLPAYAPSGKLLMPVPVFRWSRGQRLDQTLLDLQLPEYERVLTHADQHFRTLITSGDVLLRFGRELPPFPQVDVLGLGMWVAPEMARDFGVFFTPRRSPGELALFLQKPSVARIRELAQEYLALVDTGMWLLSERAVRVLMERSGWDWNRQGFSGEGPVPYELYAQFGLALGRCPTSPDPAVGELSSAVVPLPDAEFYHFGTNAQMLGSVSALQTLVIDGSKAGLAGARRQPNQVNQNSRLEAALRRGGDQVFWIENSVVPAGWRLADQHVLTGVPENDWQLRLDAGVCLDFVPVGEEQICIRTYGFNDSFSGRLSDDSTRWFGRPLSDWFAARGLKSEQCGMHADGDIQSAPLFPVMPRAELEPAFVQWLFSVAPPVHVEFARRWGALPRLSAQELCERVNLRRLFEQRTHLREQCLIPMMRNFRFSLFFQLDLESTAKTFAATKLQVPDLLHQQHEDPISPAHDLIFRSAVLRHRGHPEWGQAQTAAFALLRELMVKEAEVLPVRPKCDVLQDQIVWARSPVRLDLAGGWTDTPPYCLEHGGRVLNLAVDINGQPPIQVFAKLADRPELVVRSIDLGFEQRVRTYEELDTFAQPDSPFGLAKAAFALAGFLPRFRDGEDFSNLEQQLRDFGGGIELSLMAAVPKGSGLGTSSILAATILAALSELCGLNWDREVLFARTLVLEQMLTTGGGWQDQAGAIFRAIKLVETSPGMTQRPTVRWLPDHLFGRDRANRTILLYYTGITRLAKNILGEIVRGMFLNSPSHLDTISEIGHNAEFAGAAIQKCDYAMLVDAIRRSWLLNQRLDPGTNPPAVQEVLALINDPVAAVKLLGAGGGGYLLIFAKDDAAGTNIRKTLTTHPPNSLARFVDFSISETGLQVTKS